ncbi:MAG: DUF4388 domain-containing protein [Coleofasciculus sp. S288]|nr:DUF4388 domain-containing protein [Coleofasciculus sp. S288]
MSITGSITDFSLQEIFRFVGKGNKSGLLTVTASPESQIPSHTAHYIWVHRGDIVAAANHLNQQDLVWLIDQYPWVSNRVVTKLAQFCPPDKPLGLYLRSQGALQNEQLEHLFQVQIVRQACALLQLKDAQFKFDQNVPTPTQEMTGLSVSALVLEEIWQKLILLQKLFETRKRKTSGLNSYPENFCHQLHLVLDIAFFHSLNFSLFDTQKSFTELCQVFDLCDRPYDLPKPRQVEAMCCTGK